MFHPVRWNVASPTKTGTKADPRAKAIARFNCSKNSFDAAWVMAIEDLQLRDWYEPLRTHRGKP